MGSIIDPTINNNLLSCLNTAQREAVIIKDGPILILAGAGSGKTRALIHRLAFLIKQHHISPHNILAVTFTNKAAREMQERIIKLLTDESQSGFRLPWMGTFHAVCAKILRRELDRSSLPFSSRFIILDSQDQLSAVKKIMKKLALDRQTINPRAVANFISNAKNELLSSAEMEKYSQGFFQETALNIYQAYEKMLQKLNGLDFDDLLFKTVELFLTQPEILARYQRQFLYILIDEYQDTNNAQYKIVQWLAKKNQNLCVVGDDAQSIYGFRGANFRNILNFKRDYPQAKIIKLEQNYRSTKNILAAAQNVIEKNTQRSDKKLWTKNEIGAPVTLAELENEREEALFVINEIKSLAHLGIALNNCVVLYRTHAQSRAVEEELMKAGIVYKIIGGVTFYERKEIKDMLAYLRLLVNPADFLSLDRATKAPARGIGPRTLAVGGPKLDEFLRLIERLKKGCSGRAPAEIIDLTAGATGFRNYILDGTTEGETRWENVKELKSVASDSNTLEEFLEKVALTSQVDELDEKKPALAMMTLHNAKGLEFPAVFIIGLEEGLFPHSRSLLDPMELEEERRLCYVGLTRAQKFLYLTCTGLRKIYGSFQANPPSRFIEDIPEEILDRI